MARSAHFSHGQYEQMTQHQRYYAGQDTHYQYNVTQPMSQAPASRNYYHSSTNKTLMQSQPQMKHLDHEIDIAGSYTPGRYTPSRHHQVTQYHDTESCNKPYGNTAYEGSISTKSDGARHNYVTSDLYNHTSKHSSQYNSTDSPVYRNPPNHAFSVTACDFDSNIWLLLNKTKGHELKELQQKFKVKFSQRKNEDEELCDVNIEPTGPTTSQSQLNQVKGFLMSLYDKLQDQSRFRSIPGMPAADPVVNLAFGEVSAMYESVVLYRSQDEVIIVGSGDFVDKAKKSFIALLPSHLQDTRPKNKSASSRPNEQFTQDTWLNSDTASPRQKEFKSQPYEIESVTHQSYSYPQPEKNKQGDFPKTKKGRKKQEKRKEQKKEKPKIKKKKKFKLLSFCGSSKSAEDDGSGPYGRQ